VRLLVRERRAGEHRDRVAPVAGLDAADALGGDLERLVPRDRAEPPARAHQRFEEAIGVVVLQVALDPLGAESALVEGELLPRLDADDALVLHQQRDPALLAAEAAVRVHLAIRGAACGKAARRLVAQVRAMRVDELFHVAREQRHQAASSVVGPRAGRAAVRRGWNPASTSVAWAAAVMRRRQPGQWRWWPPNANPRAASTASTISSCAAGARGPPQSTQAVCGAPGAHTRRAPTCSGRISTWLSFENGNATRSKTTLTSCSTAAMRNAAGAWCVAGSARPVRATASRRSSGATS